MLIPSPYQEPAMLLHSRVPGRADLQKATQSCCQEAASWTLLLEQPGGSKTGQFNKT